jgi:DNA-binding SARP family transcriptional activator
VPAGRFHSREKLTALLWGDTAEVQAKHSFRQALLTLRRALGDGNPPILLTKDDALALDPAAVTVDVADFESALAASGMDGLDRAAALYKGDLLDGFGVDEPPFEEWRVVERERLRELALEVLAKLLREQSRADRCEGAIQTALRILAMDPLQEAVHRTLMRLLVRQGRRATALQQYQVCVGSLQRELGAEPEEETRALYQEIIQHRKAAPPTDARREPARQAPSPARPELVTAETPLIGREGELATLRDALAEAGSGRGRIVAIIGEAGVGKTRLLANVAAEALGRGCHVLFGRSYESAQILPFGPISGGLDSRRPRARRSPTRESGSSRRSVRSQRCLRAEPRSSRPSTSGSSCGRCCTRAEPSCGSRRCCSRPRLLTTAGEGGSARS